MSDSNSHSKTMANDGREEKRREEKRTATNSLSHPTSRNAPAGERHGGVDGSTIAPCRGCGTPKRIDTQCDATEECRLHNAAIDAQFRALLAGNRSYQGRHRA